MTVGPSQPPAEHPTTAPHWSGAAPLALELRGVTRFRGDRRILGPLDLTITGTETVAVLGANGAGKSTLLNIAATIALPSAGEIRVGGVDARKEDRKSVV